jgi:aldose 1-epimerase
VLDFDADFMLERDGAGIATRARRPVAEGPWDDCFGGVRQPVAVEWPHVLRLGLESTCDYWVVFDERDHAVCVEPQTAPPDALNHDAFVVEPGRPLVAAFTIEWTAPDFPVG